MIISHKHKFIFIKTRKTAGTSIQEALTTICGDEDIITPDVDTKGRNVDKACWNGHPHPHLWDVKQLVGDKVWNDYYKFTFVRNPFDVTVSRFFWNVKGKGQTGYELTKDGFNKWVDKYVSKDTFHKAEYYSCNLAYPFLIGVNCVDNYHNPNHIGDILNYGIDLDFVGKYENLNDDFRYVCSTLNINNLELPQKKGGFRNKRNYKEMYTKESIDKVSNVFNKDLRLLDYEFEQDFTLTKKSVYVDRSNFISNDPNINGASMISTPEWLKEPLGKYYLYFASHTGQNIRLAYMNDINGTDIKFVDNGTLQLNQTPCGNHIASPDVHIDENNKRLIMYYHGDYHTGGQKSFIATSVDGLNWDTKSEPLGEFYFRVFKYKNKFFSISKNKNIDALIYESDDWFGEFKPCFNILENVRHTAVYVKGDILYIFYTIVGDTPESIYYCKLKIDEDINNWEVISNHNLAKPQFYFEGAGSRMIPSMFGSATARYGLMNLNELRDPCVFEDNGNLYLLYTFNGEAGIAMGRLNYNE